MFATNNCLPFIGMNVIKNQNGLETTVYRKSTDTGLLLHYQSHVDNKYKRSLFFTMLNRAKQLSSSKSSFDKECEYLKTVFLKLKYPLSVLSRIIHKFSSNTTTSKDKDQGVDNTVRIILPFNSQKSAYIVKKQLISTSKTLNLEIQPVFTSKKIGPDLKQKEKKPALISNHSVVYKFQCSRCDASYVGYTCRHLYQRIEEHRSSSIGEHLKEHDPILIDSIGDQFSVLRKCMSKFDCLIYEMIYIGRLNPSLNKQSDSVRAKLFV